MGKVIQQTKKEVIDKASGEVLTSETNTIINFPKEPAYVKMYLEDVTKISNLPKWVSGILYELLKYMDFNNRVILNAGIKREIAITQRTTVQVINNTLTKFINSGLLQRKDTGVYLVNPHYFGKGSWPQIHKIRMTLTYDERGRNVRSEVFFDEPVLEAEALQ